MLFRSVEIDRAEPRQLRVGIAEQPPLEQRVVGEADAGNDMGGHECRLLGLREEIVGIAIEHHPPDDPHRQHFLGDQLGVGFREKMCMDIDIRRRHGVFPFNGASE